jgi:outer membrane protein OmpA-like peptidoglycan-associated protein
MPFNGVDYSVGHPALSQDGNTIFFVSDMPWGYGGTDLYSVTWSDGKWGEPENLGPRVNSEGNEMFPFLSADSLLYFASDGHIGLGGLDVYVTFPEPDKKWSRPENLQHPLNSSKDDFGFIIDSTNTYGYFSSNRFKNTDKLFGFKRNPPVFTLDLKVLDKKTLKPVKRAGLYHSFSGGRGTIISESGSHELSVKLNPRTSYHMLVISDGYYAKEIKYSTIGKKKSETFADSVLLTRIELNKSIRWPAIKFKGKEFNISPSTAIVLDSLYEILVNNPSLQIEILTHTDSKGAASDNLTLSRKRSDEIAFYLINKGISAPRLISLGFGETYLLNNCRDGILCLEEDHAVNNRTEIRVTGYIKPDTGMIK